MLTEEQAWVLIGLSFLSAGALYIEQGPGPDGLAPGPDRRVRDRQLGRAGRGRPLRPAHARDGCG